MSAVCEAKFDSESVPDARVTLIGTGISDYLDPLFAPGCAGEISGRVSEELRRRRDWDFCDWQDLSEGAPLAGLGSVEKETPCSAIAMQATFEKYMAAREGALRRNLRRAKAKAEEAGSVVFEVSDSAGAELMDALVRLHGTRWGGSG